MFFFVDLCFYLFDTFSFYCTQLSALSVIYFKTSRGRVKRLHSEATSRVRENQNKENEICSGMKCV